MIDFDLVVGFIYCLVAFLLMRLTAKLDNSTSKSVEAGEYGKALVGFVALLLCFLVTMYVGANAIVLLGG